MINLKKLVPKSSPVYAELYKTVLYDWQDDRFVVVIGKKVYNVYVPDNIILKSSHLYSTPSNEFYSKPSSILNEKNVVGTNGWSILCEGMRLRGIIKNKCFIPSYIEDFDEFHKCYINNLKRDEDAKMAKTKAKNKKKKR